MTQDIIQDISYQFTNFIGKSTYEKLSNILLEQFNESINTPNSITMIPSYNHKPTGSEHGNILAIDIGGSTLRLAIVSLSQNKTDILKQSIHKITNDFKAINYGFFDWISTHIVELLQDQGFIATDGDIITGLTWSFPINQVSPQIAYISNISKGYTIAPEFLQIDLGKLIEDSCVKSGLKVKVTSIINDSIAVYLTGAYKDSRSNLSLVLGTGINSCISVDLKLINTELSIFGGEFLKHTNKYDEFIDSRFKLSNDLKFHIEQKLLLSLQSNEQTNNDANEIFQPIELITSGRYIGELFRLVIIDLCLSNIVFNGCIPQNFTDSYSITGELICQLSELSINDCLLLLKDVNPTVKDIEIMKEVVDILITRGAYIIAISLHSLLKLSKSDVNQVDNSDKAIISYIGSFIHNFKNYQIKIINWLETMDDIVEFMYVEDSSILGCAIAAASAVHC